MGERTNITNLLLLSVLAGILLVSGSLQCAFDCLTRIDTPHIISSRIDTCHLYVNQPIQVASCLNKACHQGFPHHRKLGGPKIYLLHKPAQPLFSSSRQSTPQYRAGSAIILSPVSRQPELRLLTTATDHPPQALSTIRTTVILS